MPNTNRSHIKKLEDLPNVGKATAADLRLLGIERAEQLRGQDPHNMYVRLCELTGKRHDPCVLDMFIAVVQYMEGGPELPWWAHTEERKKNYKI
ncbi:helix-hairpin-helix domain-containing protein [Solimicrobium silvestre]|uniref:Pathogenicity locus n=1 Tax=Solimicrobium silvestre TaxID=2099400 RepID=A0A2S9GZB2_9BURK|nr:helix-hairpin-helix domain-containing protein [Solimicrobium silvestre]PRC93043.1 Pathogenicity locus [Solimicrobium silvestre]